MMQASSSSSCNSTSLTNRLQTIFKKAKELSILCGIEVSVICYGADDELKTWPNEREIVKDMALRYKEAKKRKKSLNLHDFLNREKKDDQSAKKKRKKTQNMNFKYPDWYPIFDHYSPHQLSQLIQSLERTLSALQKRHSVVEAQKRKNVNLIHDHEYQTQPLNSSKFSLFMYNHGDATFTQLPLPASHSNQFSICQNQLMQQDQLYGFGQNMCTSNIANSNVPCISNTQPYSPLHSVLESAVNNLMQQDQLYGFGQNMCTSNIANSNVPCVSNTQPYSPLDSVPESAVNNYGMNNYLMQQESEFTNSNALQYPSLSYNESSLLQTSSLPSLRSTVKNSTFF